MTKYISVFIVSSLTATGWNALNGVNPGEIGIVWHLGYTAIVSASAIAFMWALK